jgi:DNA-binding response OmpR family regulator
LISTVSFASGFAGFQVDVQLDGCKALHLADRETYELVICDMKMPGLDGQAFFIRH